MADEYNRYPPVGRFLRSLFLGSSPYEHIPAPPAVPPTVAHAQLPGQPQTLRDYPAMSQLPRSPNLEDLRFTPPSPWTNLLSVLIGQQRAPQRLPRAPLPGAPPQLNLVPPDPATTGSIEWSQLDPRTWMLRNTVQAAPLPSSPTGAFPGSTGAPPMPTGEQLDQNAQLARVQKARGDLQNLSVQSGALLGTPQQQLRTLNHLIGQDSRDPFIQRFGSPIVSTDTFEMLQRMIDAGTITLNPDQTWSTAIPLSTDVMKQRIGGLINFYRSIPADQLPTIYGSQ